MLSRSQPTSCTNKFSTVFSNELYEQILRNLYSSVQILDWTVKLRELNHKSLVRSIKLTVKGMIVFVRNVAVVMCAKIAKRELIIKSRWYFLGRITYWSTGLAPTPQLMPCSRLSANFMTVHEDSLRMFYATKPYCNFPARLWECMSDISRKW